ncbi:MAG: NGG1p interacting factor NIF3, partial [bacterium]
MKITEFFSYCIKCGMEADPRGREAVKRSLAFEKEKFDKMPPEEKKFYDKERLVNPYADSRILHNPLRGAGG